MFVRVQQQIQQCAQMKSEKAHIDTKPVQYLYSQDDMAIFMDLETYEQYEVPTALIEEELKYLLENMEVKIQFYGEEVIGLTYQQR